MTRDYSRLGSQGSAGEMNSIPIPDELGGIRLNRIPKGSVLARIGLEQGDIVRDVNGRPVKSTAALLAALKDPPNGEPMIRIGRMRKNGLVDPIYIELQ
jgi:S1-C subfamily serine protease